MPDLYAGKPTLTDVTLSLDTNAYTAADVLAATQVIEDVFRVSDGTAVLDSVTVFDQDDVGAAFDLYFLSADVAIGTENAAPNISDANALNICCKVAIGTGDYSDLGGVKVATVGNLRRVVQAISGSRDLAVAAVNGAGTPTYTAAGLKLRLGFIQG